MYFQALVVATILPRFHVRIVATTCSVVAEAVVRTVRHARTVTAVARTVRHATAATTCSVVAVARTATARTVTARTATAATTCSVAVPAV